MNDIDSLLSQFNPPSRGQTSLWDATPQEPTPEETDGQRLEAEIEQAFSNKALLNKALLTFLGVFGANWGVSLLTSLGIGAIASGTMGSIVLGLFFVNALTKLHHNGYWQIDKDFFIAGGQTASVAVALWVAFDEQRFIDAAVSKGKTRFYEEVKAFEIKETPKEDNAWSTLGVIGVACCIVFLISKSLK